MFSVPSGARPVSDPTHELQPIYSDARYSSTNSTREAALSNTKYPTDINIYSLDSDVPESYASQQSRAERRRATSSLAHGEGQLFRDAQYNKHSISPATVYVDYPSQRDSSSTLPNTLDLVEEQSFERQNNHRIRSGLHGHLTPASTLSLKRKARREKPHIELAPDQPPTTQGKPRARVYVACLQCRTRKIRCDGAKPVCHNCSKRNPSDNECNYDPIPKRRGPDRVPGARQRIARDGTDEDTNGGPVRRRRRRQPIPHSPTTEEQHSPLDISYRSGSDSGSIVTPTSIAVPSPSDFPPSPDDLVLIAGMDKATAASYIEAPDIPVHEQDADGSDFRKKITPLAYDDAFDLSTIIPLVRFPHSREKAHAYITQMDDDGNDNEESARVSCEPSSNFRRKIWWESLLSLYLIPNANDRNTLNSAQRISTEQAITSDIRFLFNTSNYWFSFFHIPSFFGNYFDPIKREKMQPSLVLAMLAMSTFWQSSEVGQGHAGRERALRFREEAQSALDASFNAGWIDETLAQAAWLLALFEVCAHPLHSSERSNSSLIMLDSIIRSLSLTFVDVGNPKASTFSPGAVPAVLDIDDDQEPDFNPHKPPAIGKHGFRHKPSREPSGEPGCSCRSMTLATCWPESNQHTPLWASTPAWNSNWSEAEIRKESCRRLCWSSMILAAGHTSYTTAHQFGALSLFVSDPSNYAILFSGESIAYSPALSSNHSSKDTIWALHDRSFLLWHGCIRMRNDTRATDDSKAQFAVQTWLEADALESALNRHTCRIERQFIFQAREYIFNTRMCISYEFQRYIPLVTANVNGLFHRNKAEEWLTHQATVAERFMYGLHTITGNSNNLLARRPFFVFWFMSQISRALSLWECDNTLTVAVDVCKALLPALDYLTALWPCPEQRYRYDGLRERLANACYIAGVNPPPPSNLTLPPSSPGAHLACC